MVYGYLVGWRPLIASRLEATSLEAITINMITGSPGFVSLGIDFFSRSSSKRRPSTPRTPQSPSPGGFLEFGAGGVALGRGPKIVVFLFNSGQLQEMLECLHITQSEERVKHLNWRCRLRRNGWHKPVLDMFEQIAKRFVQLTRRHKERFDFFVLIDKTFFFLRRKLLWNGLHPRFAMFTVSGRACTKRRSPGGATPGSSHLVGSAGVAGREWSSWSCDEFHESKYI